MRTILCTIAIGVILATTALAHHGWTGYDEKQTLNLTGVIREMGYDNPHGYVNLQVDDGKGKIWRAVLAPPGRMESRGLAKDMLKVGSTATVVGYPNKTDANELRVERITVAGKTTELR